MEARIMAHDCHRPGGKAVEGRTVNPPRGLSSKERRGGVSSNSSNDSEDKGAQPVDAVIELLP